MKPKTFSGSLSVIRNAGSVQGLLLARGDQILHCDLMGGEPKAREITTLIEDISVYFEETQRNPDQLFFEYQGGNVLLLLMDQYRMMILFQSPEEVDVIARACRSFLKDYAMGQFMVAQGLHKASSGTVRT